MSKSKFIHTLSESENTFALEQKAIILSFAKMLRFYWDTRYISLETNPSKSWHKIKNFLKPKGQRDYPTLCHNDKVTKTNASKAQLFAESVERDFGIESEHFDSNRFNEVNKFIIFILLKTQMTTGLLVEDVDSQSLIKLVKFLKRGKAPGPDTMHNEVLIYILGTTTSLFHHLAKLFLPTRLHPNCMENDYPAYVTEA